jgi:hypothetical protein
VAAALVERSTSGDGEHGDDSDHRDGDAPQARGAGGGGR